MHLKCTQTHECRVRQGNLTFTSHTNFEAVRFPCRILLVRVPFRVEIHYQL
jgi:hypothetical protein